MTTTVTLETLRSTLYTLLYNHLKTGTYAITNSDNIFPTHKEDQIDQYGYPEVVIIQPKIGNISQNRFGGVSGADVSYSIEIREDNSADAKTTSDEIQHKVEQKTARQIFRDAGLTDYNFDGDDYNPEYGMSHNTIHLTTLNFSFKFIGRRG
jgi:hypothetical protein